MCAWDQCSQSCFAVEPGDGATFDPSHLLLILAVFWCTIPFIRICLVLFEKYLVAPVPYALQCCRSGTRSARWTTCMSPEGGPAQPDAEKGLAVDDDDFLTALDDVDAEWDNDEDDEWGNDDDDVATLMNVVTKADIEVARAPILRRSLSQHDRDVLREEQRTWAEGVARDLRQANLGVISPEDLAKISVPAGMKAVLKSDVLAALSFGTDEIDRATAKILGEPVADAVVMRAAELAARAREAKQLDVKGASDAATVLQSLSRGLLRDWQYTPTRKVFVQRVEARLAKHLSRARVWNEKLQCGPRRKTARFDAMVRREHLRRTRFHVAAEASKRMNEKLEAPLRPPRVWQYLGAWLFVLGTHAFFAYYLITTGAQFGLQKSKVWLIESFFATVTMFLIVKPLFVVFYYLMVPSLLEENIAEAAEARKRGRRARALPFATELPTGATYYVLKRRPELAETPAGKIVASEQEASQGPHDAEAFVRSLGEAAPGRLTSIAVWKSTSASGAPDNSSLSHFSAMTLPCWLRRAVRNRHRHAIEHVSRRWRSILGHALVCLVGTFLLLHEEVQETMLEELVAALPVFASGVLGLIPTSLMERDDGVGEMMSLIVVAIWVLIAYGLFLLMRNIYHVFLEAVDPEQKAHASLRRRGPKILARLKRAASSFRRPKSPHRIAMLWSKRKARIRYKAIQRDMEARKEEEALKHKQELMRRKNFRTVKKCFESGRERAAIKVQKKWRENRIESNKRARRCAEAGEALHLKRLEFAMAEKAKEAKALHARALYHGKLFAMKAAKRAADGARKAARDIFNAAAGISEEDIIRRGYELPEVKKDSAVERIFDAVWKGETQPRQKRKEADEQMESSILNLQSRSLAPRGIVDFQITVGRTELTTMNEKMDQAKNMRQPVWERIKKDLSTNKSKIYIWVLMGSGQRVLTSFTVRRAPPNHKNKAANESRVFGAFISGTVIRGHESLGMEVHADAGIFRGESAPPIDALNVSRNDKEAASYKKLGWEEVTPAINSCGDQKLGKFHIVVHRKKFHKRVVLNVLTLGLLKREKWWTNEQKLIDMIEVYALPVDAIHKLRETFDNLNYGANDRIETRDWLESLGEQKEPMPLYMKWLLELVETESLSGAHITFGEYVGSVCYLCMFDMIGMLRWLFKSVTGRESCFLEKTDYDLLTKGLMMTNPLPYRSEDIDQLYKAYSSDRGEVYFEDWVKIAERLPMLLFALLRFQASVMKDNLGEPFWFKKKGDFDKLRTKLGVERANLLE